MSGFEFTPMGIVPLGTNLGVLEKDQIAGATANVPGPEAVQRTAMVERPIQAAAIERSAPEPLTPRAVVKMAKQRLRELDREIRRIKALEKERDELRRLVMAAAAPAKPNVRALPTRTG